MNRVMGLVVAACGVLLWAGGCNSRSSADAERRRPAAEVSTQELPSFATVIVDYSASFAPLTQTDRLALKETARALADMAVQDWSPPTTIVWRKIGTASTAAAPLCDVIEYKRSIIGAAGSAEQLRAHLDACAETVVRASRMTGAPEPYTDIADGIMMAAQNWAPVAGRKALIILSDFLEDLPKGGHAAQVQLHGESVLLLNRPGTTENGDPAAYLARVSGWKNRLIASGASSVVTLPTFRATRYSVEQALSGQPGVGTSISFVTDLVPPLPDQQTVNQAIITLSKAFAKSAAEWSAPVTGGWFVTARPAWRTTAVAPVVYTPRLARRANELNTMEAFEKTIEEMGLALQERHDGGNGDIDGTLRLISESEPAPTRYTVLLSDFATPAPSATTQSLQGERILMVYRARAATDGAQFFKRLAGWQQYLEHTGAVHVCALDITTLTESVISTCVKP